MTFERKLCTLQAILNSAANKSLPPGLIENLNRYNTPQYANLMVDHNLIETVFNSFSVSASGFNPKGSYTLEPSGKTVYFSSPTSQPSYILFTGYNNGSLTVSGLPLGQNLNVIVVGGGGGGGGGGGKDYDSRTNGGGGGGGGSGYFRSTTISSNGTFSIKVGQGGSGGGSERQGNNGNSTSILGPYLSLSVRGGSGGGAGFTEQKPQQANGGSGGNGSSRGGNGSGIGQTVGNGESGTTYTFSTFNTHLYIGGGGGGGNNTSSRGEPSGSPQGNYIYQVDEFGTWGGGNGTYDGTAYGGYSAAGYQNGPGPKGAAQLQNYWEFVGGGGGGGGGCGGDPLPGGAPGSSGGGGSNGCVLVYWNWT
jgi:hypothetical protein